MTAIKPMLAYSKNPDLSTLTYPQIVQPKFDGIRAMVVDGVLLSRSAKPIRNAEIQAALGRPEFNGLDGELLVGSPCANDAMQRSTEFVMSERKTGASWAFYVFDKYDVPGDYDTRRPAAMATLNRHCHLAGVGDLVLVQGAVAYDAGDVERIEAGYVEQGYEGAILRDPRAPYKHGRSGKTGPLLKIKRWTDAEAVCIGVNEQMTNGNEAKRDAFGRTERSTAKAGLIPAGTLGNLRCRTLGECGGCGEMVTHGDDGCCYMPPGRISMPVLPRERVQGVEFEIGTGFDAATRQAIWNDHWSDVPERKIVGRLVKYKFIPVGVKIAPRFPVFLGFRDQDDVS